MSQFYIVNESTEDTLDAGDNLDDVIRAAREFAKQGQCGEPVSVLERGGKSVRQFIRLTNGTVVEQPIANNVKP